MARGTARSPGADPTRLPIGLDIRAISIVEGVRAGLAAALPVLAAEVFDRQVLSLAALGALLTCICDPAGPIRRRLPILLTFIGLGAALLGGMGLLRGAGVAVTLLAAAPALFAASFLRAWGQPTLALGNLLAVVLLLGTDAPLHPADAATQAGIFAAGGLWALLLTLVIWRIHPYGPARRAVADVWAALAALVRATRRHAAYGAPPARWEALARGERAAVRAAIERARTTLNDTLDRSGPSSGPAAQNLMRLAAADQVFAALIAVGDVLELAAEGERRAADPWLRRLGALLAVMARATERETLTREPRLRQTIATLDADPGMPALAPIAQALAERLRMATQLVSAAQYLPGSGPQGERGVPLRARLLGPLAANLAWGSATLRHAVRATVVTVPCLAATLVWHGPYTHWLTITLVLVMQPYYALTWQRSLERVGGTLLGGAVAAALSAVARSRVHVAGLLPVLGALALAVRQVSYAVYIAVYTPTVILLVESIRPGQSQVRIAAARAGFTILGGLIAIVANRLLWPAWEPDAVPATLRRAIAAHAAYAGAVLGDAPEAEQAARRRAAGLASNNLEATLARAMQEPHRGQRDALQAVLVADATLRRIAARLAAMRLGLRPPSASAAAVWATDALSALARGEQPTPRPAAAADEPGERLARQVGLLASVVVEG